MSTHNLDDDNIFLRWSKGGEIRMSKLIHPGEVTPCWIEFDTINPSIDTLKVYDESISGAKLRELAGDLKRSKLHINREGYCYMVGRKRLMYRLNDFFSWPKYGVVPKITSIWNRFDMRTNATITDYEKKEKELEDIRLQLKEMDKCIVKKDEEKAECIEKKDQELSEKEKELEDIRLQLKEMDKCIVKKDEEKAECIEKKDQELSEKEKHIELMDQELKYCKSQLQKREREFSFLISLWERELKEKELNSYKTRLEENEREIRQMSTQLSVEQRRVGDLKLAMNSVASYVYHVNANIQKGVVDYDFASPAMSHREHGDDESTGDQVAISDSTGNI